MLRHHFIIVCILCFLASPSIAKIIDPRSYGPISSRTQHPLLLQLLSLNFESPQTLSQGQMASDVSTTFSNVFERDQVGGTRYTFDMEIWRTAFTWQYGLRDDLDIKIELPFITSSGGFMDSVIQGYHNLFGLPNAGRHFVSNNQFAFNLTQNGRQLFNHGNQAFGPSDITVRAKYYLSDKFRGIPFKLAVAPHIKLPTARFMDGLSSGYPDLGVSLLGEKNLGRFTFVTMGGAVVVTGHTKADAILRNIFFQFGQSAEFQILEGWSALVQITGSTTPFRLIDSKDLRRPAVDLNVGFAGSLPLNHPFLDEFYYQFGFSEDLIASGPSVDFSILMLGGFRY